MNAKRTELSKLDILTENLWRSHSTITRHTMAVLAAALMGRAGVVYAAAPAGDSYT